MSHVLRVIGPTSPFLEFVFINPPLIPNTNNVMSALLKKRDILAAFLLCIFVVLAYGLWKTHDQYPQWVLADWLINYHDGGFKRRGLSGSLFLLLHSAIRIDLTIIVYAAQLICYASCFAFLLANIHKKQIPVAFIALVISPLTFLFPLNTFIAAGRKEILLLALFAYYTYAISKGELSSRQQALFLMLVVISTLFHELTFFFTPYFALVHWIKCPGSKHSLRPFMYSTASLVVVACLALLGGSLDSGDTTAILASHGIHIDGGILDWPEDFDPLHFYREYPLGYSLYLIPLAIGILSFGFFFRGILPQTRELKKLGLMLLGCFAFSLPLFVLAIDWGRWLYIHFSLVLLLTSIMLPDKEGSQVQSRPQRLDSTRIVSWLLIGSMWLWAMPHYEAGFALDNSLALRVWKAGNTLAGGK